MSEMVQNVCEFCGQILLDGRECDCTDAVIHKKRLKAVDKAVDYIERMGVDFSDEELELLKQAAEHIIFQRCEKVVVENLSKEKITLQSSKNARIKIQHSKAEKNTTEI